MRPLDFWRARLVPGEDDPERMCCHQPLSPASQVALTLRAVGGLATAEVEHAFFVPEATMAQRIRSGEATIKAPMTRPAYLHHTC